MLQRHISMHLETTLPSYQDISTSEYVDDFAKAMIFLELMAYNC